MAEYPPPTNIVPIFDPANFLDNSETPTIDYISSHYLQYPNAQGTENLLNTNVNGTLDIQTGTFETQAGTTSNIRGTIQYGIGASTPITYGGFSNITYQNSPITVSGGNAVMTFQNGALINQITTAGTNTLSKTNVTGSASGGNYLFSLNETISGNQLFLLPNAGAGSYNPIAQSGDNEIVACGTKNTEALTLTTWSDTNSGVRITANDVVISAGGSISSGSTSIDTNGSTGIITLTSATPPLSTATQPATNDSSNKIPTTAWVQSAISSFPQIIPSVYAMGNNLTSSYNAFSFSINPTPSASTAQNQFITMKVTVNLAWGSSNSTTTPYSNISAYDGVIMIYPYWINDAYDKQLYYTGYPPSGGGTTSIPGGGQLVGFDPIGNSVNVPITGTVTSPGPVPPYSYYWQSANGYTKVTSAFDASGTLATYAYPNTPATWLSQRWAYSPSNSSTNMTYGSVTFAPYFQIFPRYDAQYGFVGPQFIVYNPYIYPSTYTNQPYNLSISVQVIDRGGYSIQYCKDRGGGQWNALQSNF